MRAFAIAFVASAFFGHSAMAQDLTLEPGVDRWGSDYRGFDLAADPELCRRACAADTQCLAFTYVRPGVQGPSARCYLKNPAPAGRANDCCVSGVRVRSAAVPAPGVVAVAPSGMTPRRPSVSLNPQPEPPTVERGTIVRPGAVVGLNPQPEPPTFEGGAIVRPGDIVGLNPQPEPPTFEGGAIVRPGDIVGLNPQPEPPTEERPER